MLRWVLLVVLVIGITATATVLFQDTSADLLQVGTVPFPVGSRSLANAPKAVVDKDLTYKFGIKPQFDFVEHSWLVRNEGKSDLKLMLERPPCSCTVSKNIKEGQEVAVAAGSEMKIDFKWEMRHNNGKYAKEAVILTNDPDRPKLVFKAEGEVRPAVIVFNGGEEPLVDFTDVSNDEDSQPYKIAVFSIDRPDLKITSIRSSKPGVVTFTEKPLTEDECKQLKLKTKGGYHIDIVLKPGLPIGAFREELVLLTDHPLRPEIKVDVVGKVVGPITSVPERLSMTNVSSSRGGQGEVKLLVKGQEETKFDVVKKPEGFKVVIVPEDRIGKARRYQMTVAIPPGTPSGEIVNSIVLATNHPTVKEVRIPVHVFVRDPR
jgi:hypothetical protein